MSEDDDRRRIIIGSQNVSDPIDENYPNIVVSTPATLSETWEAIKLLFKVLKGE